MTISVVICTKNEERNISRCLQSVQTIADEIIVVDSHSTDNTQAICQRFANVRFYSADWMGFSATKNYANSLATGDYILSLDADEALSPQCQQEILQLKPALQGVYAVNRKNNYCGTWIKHSGWTPDRHIRLFPQKNVSWVGEVHETLQYDRSLQVQQLAGVVLHYSYYTIEEHWARINTYSSLAGKKRAKNSAAVLLVKMMFNPWARFLKIFVFRLGILDGFAGLVIAVLSAAAVFLKYAKAYQYKTQAMKTEKVKG